MRAWIEKVGAGWEREGMKEEMKVQHWEVEESWKRLREAGGGWKGQEDSEWLQTSLEAEVWRKVEEREDEEMEVRRGEEEDLKREKEDEDEEGLRIEGYRFEAVYGQEIEEEKGNEREKPDGGGGCD